MTEREEVTAAILVDLLWGAGRPGRAGSGITTRRRRDWPSGKKAEELQSP